jgi:hypothetical protein
MPLGRQQEKDDCTLYLISLLQRTKQQLDALVASGTTLDTRSLTTKIGAILAPGTPASTPKPSQEN